MRPSFGARRKPKPIGQDEDGDSGEAKIGGLSSDDQGKPTLQLLFIDF